MSNEKAVITTVDVTCNRSVIEWDSFHSGFHDKQARASLITAIGVLIGLIVGWKLSAWLYANIPTVVFYIGLILVLANVVFNIVRMLIQRESNIIIPDAGDSFSFTFQDDKQILWQSELEDGTISPISLYKEGYKVEKYIDSRGEEWYRVCGTPNSQFVKIAKENEIETYYTITKLRVFILSKQIQENEVAQQLEFLSSLNKIKKAQEEI